MQKLRRALDPDLCFEEHNKISPLDLGEVWDRAALSATKTVSDSDKRVTVSGTLLMPIEKERRAIQNEIIDQEWGSVLQQFDTVFRYGLAAGYRHDGPHVIHRPTCTDRSGANIS